MLLSHLPPCPVPCTDTTLTPAASTAPHPMASYSDEVTIVEIGVGQASGTETEPILIENIAVEPELEEEDAEIIAAFSGKPHYNRTDKRLLVLLYHIWFEWYVVVETKNTSSMWFKYFFQLLLQQQ